MADEVRIITQPENESFDVAHCGTVRVHGEAKADPLQHRLGGEVVHSTPAERPLVHMLLWDEDCACEVNGRITVAGDKSAPVHLAHRFESDHPQTHRFETDLAKPVHHALQMRTPLQVRFCNTWQIASDYTIEIRLGESRVIGVRLTGATVAKPLPCDDEKPCEPAVVTHPVHP